VLHRDSDFYGFSARLLKSGAKIPEEHGIVEKGILVLTFDNSFSYWRSKTVRWRLDGAVLESEQAALDKAFDVEDVEID
jgi:hypothetical protein